MGRRRKIFTKREYERLSKTHEGRQTINKTYAVLAIFVFVVSLIGVVCSYYIDLLKNLRIFGYIVLVISAFIAFLFIMFYRSENKEEAERIKKQQEEQKWKNAQRLAQLEYERKMKQIQLEEEQKRLIKFKNSNMDEIDKMNGYQFEEFVKLILSDLGYKAYTTKKSGDFGVDIIVEKDNEKIIIQTKRYAKKVSINAVQEVSSAISFYDATSAWVITNNYFTDSAKQLASANDIKLIDREALSDLIIQSKEITQQSQSA